VITAVTSFGFFVELNDIYVEGLVHISNLKDDFYSYDPATHSLNGERTRRSFALGDTVEVQVVRVNSDERKVDFELISHEQQHRFGKSGGPGKKKGGRGQKDGRKSQQDKGKSRNKKGRSGRKRR